MAIAHPKGHRVSFATERGDKPPSADPPLLSGVLFGKLGAEPEPKSFYAEMIASPDFAHRSLRESLNMNHFEGLILPGGHAPGMRQYLGSVVVQQKIRDFFAENAPSVRSVMAFWWRRGPACLKATKPPALPMYMERLAYFISAWKLGTYYRTYPAYVEEEVRAGLSSPSDFVRDPSR